MIFSRRNTKEEYDKGYEAGKKDQKDYYDSLVEQKANSMYSSRNWLVNPNHVFSVTPNSNIPYINQEPITKDKAGQLKSEADLLDKFLLWSVLQETIKQKAIQMAVMESTTFEQVMFGKAMIHNLGIMKAVVSNILKLDISKIPDKAGK